jgi:hypothetical protein
MCRRQLVPGFHKAWLDHMVGLFGDCSTELIKNLDKVGPDTLCSPRYVIQCNSRK